jgi:CDP-paratose 2-epimerase
MKILITGGCGFLGSNIASKILSDSTSDLFLIDDLSRFGSELNLKWLKSIGNVNFQNISVSDQTAIENVIKKIQPNFIFHLAGQVAMTTSIENPRRDFEINALGTLNVLESVRKFSKDTTIIYSSTNKVYGDFSNYSISETLSRYIVNEKPNGFDETESLNFHSPYGCSKGAADQYLLDYYRLYGIKTIVFRHSSMYGGRQFSTFDQGWIGWFCKKAIEIKNGNSTETITIAGNGKQVRDLLYVDDAVNLYLSALNNIDQLKGQAFNIGGGTSNSMSILELFDFLESELQISINYKSIEVRQSDQKVFIADYSKINKVSNWNPIIDKFLGLRNNLDWLRNA